MSYLPCSNCRNTKGVTLKYIYLMYFVGSERIKTRAKLCEPCMHALLDDYLAVCDQQRADGEWELAP